jgi:CO/xanthine dehydrogenase FAD-binding subunit
LDYVKAISSGLRIGASTTFTGLLESEGVNSRPAYGSLVDALSAIRPVQVRNVATVGGALSSGVATFDLPPTSLAMDATVILLGPKGRRTVPVQDFFVGFLETATKRGEFLTEVRIPRPPTNSGSAFLKLEMNSVDWAVLNVATKLTLRKGRVSDARIVFGGGVGAVPVRATKAEGILENKEPTAAVIREAAESASMSTKFTSDERASAEYRREVSKVLLRDALLVSVDRARRDSK